MKFLLLSLIVFIGLSLECFADSTINPSNPIASKPESESAKIWNLNNADIRAVIAQVAKITGKSFIIDPRVEGKISIVSSKALSNTELYQVFLSILQISGFAAIPSGSVVKIVPNNDAKTQFSNENDKHPPQGEEMMVKIVTVKHVPAEQLVPILRPLMPVWSSISSYAPSNMLILSGRANNIMELSNIIQQVDNSSATEIDIIELKHALSMDVVNLLKDLIKTQNNSPAQVQITSDDRSNTILISGSKADRLKLHLIIKRLDGDSPKSSNATTEVIYLNYLRAEDVVPILAGIAQANFSGSVGTTIGTITRPLLDSTNPSANFASNANKESSEFSNAAATPNTKGTSTQNESGNKTMVQIIAEPNTNSVIINAPHTLISTLKSVVTQLDIKPAQILIEALIAEINENDMNNLGIEWGTINQKSLANESFRSGFAILNTKTQIADFQAQIHAMSTLHKANILSTPSVVVLDNRQAKILIGKQVSVQSSSYPGNNQGSGTVNPYTTFDRVNVALHLYVRPQITRGRGIQMQIDQGNDTLDNNVTSPDGNTNPTFNISAIVTSVHVESGDIIVLGGLAKDSLDNDNKNLPILSDIPGIGRLFQHNRDNREKKVLMVFIRPRILQTEADGLALSNKKYNEIRKTELSIIKHKEQFKASDAKTILPPLNTVVLPKPFSHAIKTAAKGSKNAKG